MIGLGLILLTGCGPAVVNLTESPTRLPLPTILPTQTSTQLPTLAPTSTQPTDPLRTMVAALNTNHTVDGVSKYDGPSWGSADAELRICRVDSTFNLYKRPVGETTWTLALTVDRPDLPAIVQVGPNIYSDGKPDLQVRYDNLALE